MAGILRWEDAGPSRGQSWKLSHQTFLPVFRSSSFSTVAVVVPFHSPPSYQPSLQMTQRLPMAVLAKASSRLYRSASSRHVIPCKASTPSHSPIS